MYQERPVSLEICAGAGGQALGLEQAGFAHAALVEIEADACSTLQLNRPEWNVLQGDLRFFDGKDYRGIDLLAGGVPCPPFSKAGKQLGKGDDRNLFPEALRLLDEIRPRAVMIENVRGLLDKVFQDYRQEVVEFVRKLGYVGEWRLLNSSDYGVSQLRPRSVFVALQKEISEHFDWPEPLPGPPKTVGDLLFDLMKEKGWRGAKAWRIGADKIAPTLVGGSRKHGGADLGPTRAKQAWAALGVDAHGVADAPPGEDFDGMPRLTTKMTARVQGFPDEWHFFGRKTSVYRQIGNAFPPPVAKAVAKNICGALRTRTAIRVAS